MPTYRIKAPDGRTLRIDGPTPPSEAEMDAIFAQAGSAQQGGNQQTARTEDFTEQPPPQTVGRFLKSAATALLPSTTPSDYIEGPLYALRHPIESAKLVGGAVVDARSQQLQKAAEAEQQGRTSEQFGHRIAAAIPLIGPAAATAGEQIGSGDVAGGLGTASGLLVPSALAGARNAPLRASISERTATTADRLSQEKFARVVSPNVGANKVRFGNQARKVAERAVREPELGATSRAGLQAKAEAGLANAEAALDAAADARDATALYDTQPILDAIQSKYAELSASAAPNTPGAMGQFRSTIPAPNQARADVLKQAYTEVAQLGAQVPYEAIRRLRQAYDAPAKAVYNSAVTPDYMKNLNVQRASADVAGALREGLAKMDPRTAKANADYAFYRSLTDVLKATEEVQRTRPTIGRKMLTSAVTGGAGTAISPGIGTAIGVALGPLVDEMLNLGVTSKIYSARLLARYADAVRAGRMKQANGLVAEMRQVVAAGSRGAGRMNVAAQEADGLSNP